jgi:hypothetical protein
MNAHRLFAIPFVLVLTLPLSSVLARDKDEPAAYRLITSDGEEAQSSSAPEVVPMPGQTGGENGAYSVFGKSYSVLGNPLNACDGCYQPCYPRWVASADALILDRNGGKSRTLLAREIPGDGDGQIEADGDLLNTDDFAFGFRAGPRVSVIRQGECYDFEALYFGIDGWSSTRIVPVSESWFEWKSRLYDAELNVRWNPCCRVAALAGFRWAQVRERFAGGRIVDSIFQPPIGDVNTTNNLYGFQIGADAKLLEKGCFSIDALVKGGIYNNHAEHNAAYDIQDDVAPGTIYRGFASTNHTAFIGEIGLQASYQITCNFRLRAGYMLLWIDGVALAPDQLGLFDRETLTTWIDANDTAFYHGATAGFELKF